MAKVITKDPIQAERRFVIAYYLSDDTVNIHEPPMRNSGNIKSIFIISSMVFSLCQIGIGGGKFLERQRVKKPNQTRHPLEVSDYFSSTDFYVGARVVINGFDFYIYDADEYAFKLMEQESSSFPVSNQRIILEKLRRFFTNNSDSVAQFEQHDPHHKGYFGYETFYYLMKNLVGDILVDHEIITLARSYAQKLLKEQDIYSVVSVAQDHLRKNNFEHLLPLKENLITRDRRYDRYLFVFFIRFVSHLAVMVDYLLKKFVLLYVQFMFHYLIIF
jgi:hypothetical protein